MSAKFSQNCTRCDRLSGFLKDLRIKYPDYHNKPVPAFGDPASRLLIVGLAPGMHGANATGRPFTGDYAGVLLYQTLFDFGFAVSIKYEKPVFFGIHDPLHDLFPALRAFLRSKIPAVGVRHSVLLVLV